MDIVDKIRKSLKSVDCVICGTNNCSTILTENMSSLVRCNNCGLIYFNPQPDNQTLNEYYAVESAGSYVEVINQFNKPLTKEQITYLSNDLDFMKDQLARISPHLTGGQSINFLEIGCAFGRTLYCASLKGWNVVGIEPSITAVNMIRQNYKLNVYSESVIDVAGKFPGHFELVFMSHVLEHMPNPKSVVEAVHSMLKPGGIAVIYVPNGGGIQAKYDMAKWEWTAFPGHLWYFTPDTLRSLLEKSNYRIDQMWSCLGHSQLGPIMDIVKERLFLDTDDQARLIMDALGPMCLLSDLRVIAVKK